MFSLLYGVAAYAINLATLLYMIGFCGNLLVPKTLDSGAAASWPQALGIDLLLLALFGVQHSVMARQGFKSWWTRIVPPAVERSTYVLFTCLVLGLLFWQWQPIPEPLVWRVGGSAASILWALFGLGWLIVLISTFLINHFELFGLQQVFARFTGKPFAEARFRTPLFYRHVRHPLYAGLLLSFWSAPVMSAGHLLFSAGATTYIFIGIWFEERDLIATFGERYRRYRDEVGMLWPWPRPRTGMPPVRDGAPRS
jgi:protein-S-isoprenylcysteine O-methyltransferase Ste14